MSRKWSPKKAMQAWHDIQHINEYGVWPLSKTPKWYTEMIERYRLGPMDGYSYFMLAYQKIAETFINEYIKAGRNG